MSYIENLPQLPLPESAKGVPGLYWEPKLKFIEELATFLKKRKVLEIFAGNGYLAGLLHARGVRVTATTRFASHDAHERGLYHPVEELDAVTAVSVYGDKHDVLLISWPTVSPVVLHAVREWGPDKDIVFIGEVTDYSKGHLGGCATDAFFERVAFSRKFDSYQCNMLETALVGRLKETP
jgi:hypothetical protein